MINNRLILLILPLLLILIIAIELYTGDKSNANNAFTTGPGRQTSSVNFEKNLTNSLKKINDQQKVEASK